MSFTSELAEALELRNPDKSVDAVHRIVTNGLRELDPHAELKRTGYFNHSWAPDFVVRWSPDTEGERFLYLRFDVEHESFVRELELLETHHPIFLGMRPRRDNLAAKPRQAPARLHEQGLRLRTLVTEAGAVERFHDEVSRRKDARTATRAVMRGGQGIVDEPAAAQIATAYEAAVDNIESRRERVDLRASLDAIEVFLDRTNALHLERALRSRWIGAGASPFDFPGLESWDLGARTTEEIADLVEALLDQSQDVPAAQWAEIAAYVTADALGLALRSREPRRGGRLNDLVRAALSTWNAQWAYTPQLPSDSMSGVYDWSITNYGFGLQLINREVFFSDDGRRFSQVPTDGVLPDIAARFDLLADPAIVGVGLVTPQEDVAITLRETATHSIGELIQDLIAKESIVWRTARVAEMLLQLRSFDAEARIDFRRNVVTASRLIPLRAYVELVAKYVAALPEDDMETLRESQSLTSVEPS